ncbi:septal ring lytic transglycosylase RlpA family protein [Pseudopontixanthobacter vadosimaris]|uniref:septal ring lytic transglycosylase RlpA family protein n=1 Tax=Pseudopontixanthobacter vadosimaris TaxID=2726450 RepID=UPI00147362BE|nr:septal ring lytic transglycosylase RlpA family protein [Pseudopontixanthobacter vadosimaris]
MNSPKLFARPRFLRSGRHTAGRRIPTIAAVLLLPNLSGAPVAAQQAVSAEFTAEFVRFRALPAMPQPAGNVVDITRIDPPVEEEPAARVIGSGNASYYGKRFAGKRTASGERFDPGQLTAAHRTLPFGSLVQVTNPANGRSVTVRINDRGPFHGNRIIDLSRSAAEGIGIVQRGHGHVELALLD